MNKILAENISRLENGFEHIERETPFLKPVAKAFREVFIIREVLKTNLPERSDIHIPLPDRTKLLDGYPWLTEKIIASFNEPWGDRVELILRLLIKTFPRIGIEVNRTIDTFEKGTISLESCISAYVEGREEDIIGIASKLSYNPMILKFIMGQILKPFVEKRTEALWPLIDDLPWRRGYCPICGEFPELSFLQGDDKKRWLRCSLCGYEWRFSRMACPYCGEINENREFICVYGAEDKWVELCPDCHRYIVGIDLKKQTGITTDVAAISMIHLDVIAQQRGFFPTAECAWNMVFPNN